MQHLQWEGQASMQHLPHQPHQPHLDLGQQQAVGYNHHPGWPICGQQSESLLFSICDWCCKLAKASCVIWGACMRVK